MSLLDGGLASVFAGAFSSFYLDAELHRAVIAPDGKGGGTVDFVDPEPVKAQLDKTIERTVDGNVDTFQRILVLAHGLAPISTDDEITVKGTRWAIALIDTDPAGAYFDLAGRKSGRDGGS